MRRWWFVLVGLGAACFEAGEPSATSPVEPPGPGEVAAVEEVETAAPTDEPDPTARVSLSLQRLPVSELPAVAQGVGLELRVPPELIDAQLTVATDVPVSRTEARWVLRVALEAQGLVVYPSGVLARLRPAPPQRAVTRVARVRAEDAAEAGRLTERTWRGRLSVRWEGSLIAVSGPQAEVEQAIGRLYETDRVAREVLGGG